MSKKGISPKSAANKKSGGAKNLKRGAVSGRFLMSSGKIRARVIERNAAKGEAIPKRRSAKASDTFDWTAFDAMTDEDIARAVAEDPDAAPIRGDDFWKNAKVVYPVPKQAISIRLDEDVLAYFKDQGPGYQSRINAVLRSYVDTKK